MKLKDLRQLAEKQLRHRGVLTEEVTELDSLRLLSELRTHQIELELQNDELFRAQQALLKSHDRYADLYHSAPIGYVTFDKEGYIIDANAKFAQMLDMAVIEVIQKPFSNFIDAQDQDSLYLLQRNLNTAQNHQSCELRLLDSAGNPHWVRIDCNATIQNDVVSQIRASVSDISSLKHTEQLLRQSRAEHVNQSKSDYISYITHELRPPMKAILAFAQQLEAQTESEQKEISSHIISSGEHLLSLINDLLDLSRIEAGEYNLNIESIDLIHTLHDCLTIIEPLSENRR